MSLCKKLKQKSYFLLFSALFAVMLFAPFSLRIDTYQAQLTLSADIANAGWLDGPFEGFLKTIDNWVASGVRAVTIGVAYLVLKAADTAFSGVLYYSLVNFGQTFNNTFKDAVDQAWTLSRDFANLIIISMFVYAAVGTILRLKDYNLEKFIVKIIIVALLINFSMFMVKFTVDVSNVIAYQFYKEIATLAEQKTDANNQKNEQIYIGSLMAKKMGVSAGKIISNKELDRLVRAKEAWWYTTFIVYPVIGFIIAFTAAVLFYGTFVMLSRFLGLLLVMALSAIGFVMLIVPKLGDTYFQKWWQGLLRYSLFAPIFSFMLLLTVTIIAYIGNVSGAQNSSLMVLMATGSWASAIIAPFVVIGLLFAAIKISNSLSIAGSNIATKIAGTAMSAALFPALWGARAVRLSGTNAIATSKGLHKLSESRFAKFTGLYKPIDQLRYKAKKSADNKAGMHIGDTFLGKKLSDAGVKLGSSMKGIDKYQKAELKEGVLNKEKAGLERKIKKLQEKASKAEEKINEHKSGTKKGATENKVDTEKITTKVKEQDTQNQAASDARAQAEEQAQKAATGEKIVKVAQEAKHEAAQAVSDEKAKNAVQRLREKISSLQGKDAREIAGSILNDSDLLVQDYSPEIQKSLSELESAYRQGDTNNITSAYNKLSKNIGLNSSDKEKNEHETQLSTKEMARTATLKTTQQLSDKTIKNVADGFTEILNNITDKETREMYKDVYTHRGGAKTTFSNAIDVFHSKGLKDNPTVNLNGEKLTLKEAVTKLFERSGIDTSKFTENNVEKIGSASASRHTAVLTPEQRELKAKRSWFEQFKRNRQAKKLKDDRRITKEAPEKIKELEKRLEQVNQELGEIKINDPSDVAYQASKLKGGAQKKFVENLKRNLDDKNFEDLIKEMEKHKKTKE